MDLEESIFLSLATGGGTTTKSKFMMPSLKQMRMAQIRWKRMSLQVLSKTLAMNFLMKKFKIFIRQWI